jgi:hypothetical protein
MTTEIQLSAEEEIILNSYCELTGLSRNEALIEALQMLEQQYAEKHKLAHAREFVTNHDRDLMSRLDD